ncbi:ABC transporter ATP-binding protein/permease [uncultured Dechloromonas sp.]|uniref:ABC transporter ATP-binding protein/permease n=1 Tax=uncultured Dechloromonas sp. TaxID=171719 RepID=UPI0025EDCEF5|nr:ABC transporter ATP-binding protein/permease [uncultured Dechloromonas sp.]
MTPSNLHLWKRFWALATPYWRHEEKWRAWGLIILLVVLLLGQTRFAVLFNEQTGEFTSALAAQDEERFWNSIKLCLGLLAFAIPVYAFYFFVRDTLGIYWRRWLTGRFLDSYFRNRHFYELNANAAIDNPDQRMTEDIATFTQRSLYFLLIIVSSTLQLVAFSAVLWSISHELVYFLVFYATAGTCVVIFVFGQRLMSLNFNQLRREADFRFSLVRVRENAESIAFYRGEALELGQVKHRFGAAFSNFKRLVRTQFWLNLFQQGYFLFTLIIPSAIIADNVLSGDMEVGRAVQAAGAFAAVLGAISMIIENFEGLSRFAAGIDRLDMLARYLPPDPVDEHRSGNTIDTQDAPQLEIDDLTLMTPNAERVLIQNLSLTVRPGESLLIVGESGSGKSSLLRAVAGLWYAGSGSIRRPAPHDMLFLPQQPYMVLGSLRNQLLYPNADLPVSDDDLLAALERVSLPNLAHRVGGLDAERDWPKLLSVGEQQRLAFARLLLTRPRFAILDEATSALDIANETNLYQQLLDTQTTVISVGHRTTILKFHTQVLELDGCSAWRTVAAADYRFEH